MDAASQHRNIKLRYLCTQLITNLTGQPHRTRTTPPSELVLAPVQNVPQLAVGTSGLGGPADLDKGGAVGHRRQALRPLVEDPLGIDEHGVGSVVQELGCEGAHEGRGAGAGADQNGRRFAAQVRPWGTSVQPLALRTIMVGQHSNRPRGRGLLRDRQSREWRLATVRFTPVVGTRAGRLREHDDG